MHHHLVKSNSTLITDLDNNWEEELIKKIRDNWVNGGTRKIKFLDTIPNIVEYIVEYIVKDEKNLDTIPNILEAEFKKCFLIQEIIKIYKKLNLQTEYTNEDLKEQFEQMNINQLKDILEESRKFNMSGGNKIKRNKNIKRTTKKNKTIIRKNKRINV